jgi:hypothetical protein
VKYLMFVCTDTEPDTDPSPEPDIDRWVSDNDTAGRRLVGMELAPPFAETKELIVGFDLLECADLEEAVEVARAHPMARHGRIEVRPAGAFEQ